MPLNVHGNTNFLMPEGEKVGIEELENTIHTNDISDFALFSPQDGQILIYDAANQVWRNLPRNLKISAMEDVTFSGLNDGDTLIWNNSMSRWINSSYIPDALQGTYGGNAGIHAINWGGQVRAMNVDFYNGKAWAEILVSADTAPDTPWQGWIAADNKLQSFNLTDSGSMAIYETGASSVLAVPEVTTNLLFTAKSSITGGINTGSLLDLSHMTSTNRQEFLDYFAGLLTGFSQVDTFAATGGAGQLDTHLGFRAGTVRDSEWLLMDSIEGNSIGAATWGYRSTGGSNVKGGRAGGQPISSTNVFSVFATNY